MRRVRDERPALEDQLQVVTRALGILESGRAERRQARQADLPARRELAIREELTERAMHRRRDRTVPRLELSRRARRRPLHADASRDASELLRILGQGMGLELVQDLQPVLDGSEVHIGLGKQPAEFGRQVSALGEAEDGLQRVRLAQPRVVATVEELQGLHDELDLADSTPSELDVGRLAALRADGAVDLRFHRADRRDDARVDAGAIDGLAREVPEAGADGRVAGRDARLDQGLALPQLGALAIVRAVPVEREHDRSHAPFGSKSQIDAEGVALVGTLLEQ